jgi:hypothetical protein
MDATLIRTAVTGDEIVPLADTAVPTGNPDKMNQLAVAGLNVLEKTSS